MCVLPLKNYSWPKYLVYGKNLQHSVHDSVHLKSQSIADWQQRFDVYIAHIYSGERDKCSALVTRNNKIRLLEL